MTTKTKPSGATDAEIIALLNRYKCPTPFHEVRVRLMGTIASPAIGIAPMETIKQLWHGELPAFESMDALNDLFNALTAGLWNRLTEHQNSRTPFKLIRFDVAPTREELKHFATVRKQELDGFVEGLFGRELSLNFPERAHDAIGVLAKMRAFFDGMVDLLEDETKPAPTDELKKLIHNIQAMTLIMEKEMNTTILSCKRSRAHQLEQMSTAKPTLH